MSRYPQPDHGNKDRRPSSPLNRIGNLQRKMRRQERARNEKALYLNLGEMFARSFSPTKGVA
jgi:hypothetical protein